MKNIQQHLFFIIIGMMLGVMLGFCIDNEEYYQTTASVIGIGATTALLEFFLQFCYQPGNIFGWYREWLDNHVANNRLLFIQQLYSPLGGCAFCQNTWLAIGAFFIGHAVIGLSWWMILPVIVVSHLFLTILGYIFWE